MYNFLKITHSRKISEILKNITETQKMYVTVNLKVHSIAGNEEIMFFSVGAGKGISLQKPTILLFLGLRKPDTFSCHSFPKT